MNDLTQILLMVDIPIKQLKSRESIEIKILEDKLNILLSKTAYRITFSNNHDNNAVNIILHHLR